MKVLNLITNDSPICFNHAVLMIQSMGNNAPPVHITSEQVDESVKPRCLACEQEQKQTTPIPGFYEKYLL